MAAAGKLALFDLDNTLIDRQAAFGSWAEHFVAERGLEAPAVELLRNLDRDGFASREEVFAALAERYPGLGSVDELVALYRAAYPSCIPPVPEVVAQLARLREAGWKLAIVTNGPVSQHEKISRSGLAGSFDACCVSADLGIEKPDRRIFEEAALRCGAPLAGWTSRWMVGDAPGPDVAGGIAAGLRTIWMHRGRAWPETGYRPDAARGSVAEAVDLLLSA